jgi:hypothetical protein
MNSAKRQHNWKPADIAFLAMAMVLHASLLLLPLKSWQNSSPAAIPRLTIDLQKLPRPTQQAEVEKPGPENTPTEKSEPEPEPDPAQRQTARIALEKLPAKPQDISTTEATTEPELLTARQLRELVKREALAEDTGSTERQLGSARPYQPPANWNKNAGVPYLAEFDNRFNGMTVPEDVEIVDRWMAADGSHNVVLNMPNGDTLCGRAEAWNPMQPLVEHVMMFRPCGGGGKRTFTMPDRYNKGQ